MSWNRGRINCYKNDKLRTIHLMPKKTGLFPVVGLCFLIIISLSVPILILAIDELEIGFGFIITLAIFGGSAYYFLRHFLWAIIGKEVFEIHSTKVVHYFDFGLFKDGVTSLECGYAELAFSRCESRDYLQTVESAKDIEDDGFECHLGFITDEDFIRSHTSVLFTNVSLLNKEFWIN